MATNTITAAQWSGDLEAVKKRIGRSKFDGYARGVSFSIEDDGRLRVETLSQLMPIYVEEGQWLTYDLEVFDDIKFIKGENSDGNEV